MKAVPWNQPFIVLAVGACGALFASTVDIDRSIPLLVHRSIITHGFLITGILWGVWLRWQPINNALHALMIGYGSGVAVHLAFDLWPAGWYGYALISIPIFGRLPPVLSFLWIFISILACLMFARWTMNTVVDMIAAGCGVLYIFYRHIGQEALPLPLLTFAACAAAVYFVPPDKIMSIVKEWMAPEPKPSTNELSKPKERE